MEQQVMYLVIGGAPQYHVDDDKYSEIYGLFTDENNARHCFHYNKSIGEDCWIVTIPVNEHLQNFYLSIYCESNIPKPIGECKALKEFFVVMIGNNLFGAFYDKEQALKLKKELDKKFSKDDNFKSQFTEIIYKNPYQHYPTIKGYNIMDLKYFDFDKSIIGTEFEPIKLNKIPGFYKEV